MLTFWNSREKRTRRVRHRYTPQALKGQRVTKRRRARVDFEELRGIMLGAVVLWLWVGVAAFIMGVG